MIKNLLFMVFLAIGGTCFGQIFMADSTVQAIAYWSLDETYEYDMSVHKYTIKDGDTTRTRSIYYEMEMSILDSTENSYTVQWLYKNIRHSDLDSLVIPIESKLIFKTNELGEFEEILDVGEFNKIIENRMSEILKNTEAFKNVEESLQFVEEFVKDDVFAGIAGYKDLNLYLNDFGIEYKLGEIVEGEAEVANLLGGEPFIADYVLMMDEIDLDDYNYRIRYQQEIRPEQLTEEVVKYINALVEEMGGNPPDAGMFEGLENKLYSTSIIHESGWVVFVAQTMVVTMESGFTKIEERYIEMK